MLFGVHCVGVCLLAVVCICLFATCGCFVIAFACSGFNVFCMFPVVGFVWVTLLLLCLCLFLFVFACD